MIFFTHLYTVFCFFFIPIHILIAASYNLRRDSELDSEGVYLLTESRDRKSLQIPYAGMPEKMDLDILNRKSKAIHILLCEKMGPFVLFYFKI